jgi:hypothetical protein
MTVPAPVRVTVVPKIVAGPETTEYVIAPGEFEVALTANGASPYVWFAMLKVIVGGPVAIPLSAMLCVV